MRLGVAALLLIVIASCSQAAQPNPTSPAPDPRAAAASQALDAVWASLDRSAIFDAFPRKAGIEACVINIGPPPGRGCRCDVQHGRPAPGSSLAGDLYRGLGRPGLSCDGLLPRRPSDLHVAVTVDHDDVIVRQVHFGDFPPRLVF